jgi:hypothetical protein
MIRSQEALRVILVVVPPRSCPDPAKASVLLLVSYKNETKPRVIRVSRIRGNHLINLSHLDGLAHYCFCDAGQLCVPLCEVYIRQGHAFLHAKDNLEAVKVLSQMRKFLKAPNELNRIRWPYQTRIGLLDIDLELA